MSCSLLSDYFTIQRLLTLNFELKVTTILNVLTTLASNLFHRAVWLPAAWMTVLVYQTWRKTRSHALAKYLGSETDVKLCFPQPMDMSFQVGHISMSSCLNFWQKVLKISLNEACPCWPAQTRFASRMTRPSLFEEQLPKHKGYTEKSSEKRVQKGILSNLRQKMGCLSRWFNLRLESYSRLCEKVSGYMAFGVKFWSFCCFMYLKMQQICLPHQPHCNLKVVRYLSESVELARFINNHFTPKNELTETIVNSFPFMNARILTVWSIY